jgi:carbon storage regulator
MLILSRKQDEKVDIVTEAGERIELVVVDVGNGKVRIGFEAAKSTAIHRREVTLAIQAEKQVAAVA